MDVNHHIGLGRGVRQDYRKKMMGVMRNFWVGRFLQSPKTIRERTERVISMVIFSD
jgi:hypothetical protein